MFFTDDELYPLYLVFLENHYNDNPLMKISESFFIDFKKRYEKNPDFQRKIELLSKKKMRNEKLGSILDDDFDI